MAPKTYENIVFKADRALENEIYLISVSEYPRIKTEQTKLPVLNLGFPNSKQLVKTSENISRTYTIGDKNFIIIPLEDYNREIKICSAEINIKKRISVQVDDMKYFATWHKLVIDFAVDGNVSLNKYFGKVCYFKENSSYQLLLQQEECFSLLSCSTDSTALDISLSQVGPALQKDDQNSLNEKLLNMTETNQIACLKTPQGNYASCNCEQKYCSQIEELQYFILQLVFEIIRISGRINLHDTESTHTPENSSLVDNSGHPESLIFVLKSVSPTEVFICLKDNAEKMGTQLADLTPGPQIQQLFIIPVYFNTNWKENSNRIIARFDLECEVEPQDGSVTALNEETPGRCSPGFTVFTTIKNDKTFVFIIMQDEKDILELKINETQKSYVKALPPITMPKAPNESILRKSLESQAETLTAFAALNQDHKGNRGIGDSSHRRPRSSISTNASIEVDDDFERKTIKVDKSCQTTPQEPAKSVTPTPEKKYKQLYLPRGLTNMGNTCYMNSVLQCLMNTHPLYLFFSDMALIRRLPKPQKRLSLAFAALVEQVKKVTPSTSLGNKYLAPIKNGASELNPIFAGTRQNDALEFFSTLLDGFIDELNQIEKRPPYKQLKTDPVENIQAMSDEWFNYMRSSKSSIISDVFNGQLFNTSVCIRCQKAKYSFQDCQSISLSFKGCNTTSKGVHLEKMFEKFLQEECSRDYWCNHCDEETECVTRTVIWRLPQVLVVHLKRFEQSARGYSKIDTPVTFQTETFDMREFVQESEDESTRDAEYSLFAYVNHFGSLGGGHYTATCLDLERKVKYNISDENISKEDWKPVEETTRNPLILFYIKKSLIV